MSSLSAFVDSMGVMLFIVTLLSFVLLHISDGSWEGLTQASCIGKEKGCFCERPRNGLIRQPSNTYSNLAFTLCGVLAFSKGFKEIERIRKETPRSTKDKRNYDSSESKGSVRIIGLNLQSSSSVDRTVKERLGEAFIITYGISCMILGFGSGFFHASLTLVGQFLDNAGMYVVIISSAVYSWESIRHQNRIDPGLFAPHHNLYIKWFIVNACVLNFKIVMQLAGKFGNEAGKFYFIGLILTSVFLELYARRVCYGRSQLGKIQYPIKAGLIMAVSFFVWILDQQKIVCDPDSIIQGHAIWHILDGVAAYYVFLYFLPMALDSEEKKDMKQMRSRLVGLECGLRFKYEVV